MDSNIRLLVPTSVYEESVLDNRINILSRIRQAARIFGGYELLGGAEIVPIADGDASLVPTSVYSNKFTLPDASVVLAAQREQYPILTTNSKMPQQIDSDPVRRVFFGGVDIYDPGPPTIYPYLRK